MFLIHLPLILSLAFKVNDWTVFLTVLSKIRNFYSHEEQDIESLNYIINNYDLSKREIRKIIEYNDENNDAFSEKILK